jgi:hypothetical protein
MEQPTVVFYAHPLADILETIVGLLGRRLVPPPVTKVTVDLASAPSLMRPRP